MKRRIKVRSGATRADHSTIQGGAEFGYTLIWVVVAPNLMAMLLQTL